MAGHEGSPSGGTIKVMVIVSKLGSPPMEKKVPSVP